MTTVVNINHEKPDYWCTRSTIFGNPFKIGVDGDRNQCIEKFKTWFTFLLEDKMFVKELEKLRNKKLGCFCKQPDKEIPCHVDIIANYLNNTKPIENIKKKVAVVGSRNWPDFQFIFNILDKNKDRISYIISGGAQGVDTESVNWSIKNGIPYIVYPALWHDPITGVLNRSAGFVRNHYIVNEADIVLAFQFNKSKGTQHTIEITKKIGKPIKIYEL